MEPEREIVCVDCGGRCFLISYERDDRTWYPGDIVTYRCQDCRDRWDLVLPEFEDGTESSASGTSASGKSAPGDDEGNR